VGKKKKGKRFFGHLLVPSSLDNCADSAYIKIVIPQLLREEHFSRKIGMRMECEFDSKSFRDYSQLYDDSLFQHTVKRESYVEQNWYY